MADSEAPTRLAMQLAETLPEVRRESADPLGSGLESDGAVRAAAYAKREQERHEQPGGRTAIGHRTDSMAGPGAARLVDCTSDRSI